MISGGGNGKDIAMVPLNRVQWGVVAYTVAVRDDLRIISDQVG